MAPATALDGVGEADAEVDDLMDPHEADEGFELTPEMKAELEESIAEIERGEWTDGDEFLEQLRKRRRHIPVS